MSAILKTYIHKVGGCSNLQRYLEKDKEGNHRTLAFDFSPRINNPAQWSAEFDSDRKNFRKDFGRKCYHFVISPDPTDEANLEQVRQLATSWVNQNFSNSKYAIYYHDDNNDGILHAHICVNAVQFDGYKIHIDRKKYDNIRLDTHHIAENLGMKTPAPKSEREIYLENIYNNKNKNERQKFFNPKTASEKRIENRGFRTWKQQLRDLIDINKTYARGWDDFVQLMKKDGVEVRETFNHKTKEIGYTYHFIDPVFNKKTKKEFHFACKDKNLSDDPSQPNKYCREKIIECFDYCGSHTPNLQMLSKQKTIIKKETLVYYGWLPLVYPKPHRKQTGTLVKHNHKLPKTIKHPEIKTYHGKLAYSTINNSLANINAMTEAIRIIKQQNIKSKADLCQLYAKDLNKIENLKKKREKWQAIYDEVYVVNTHANNYLAFNDESEKQWLEDHNYKFKIDELHNHREVLESVQEGIEQINEQIEAIQKLQQEREKAFNIIKNNIEPKHITPRSIRTKGNSKRASIKYVPYNSSAQYKNNRKIEQEEAEKINLQNEQNKRLAQQSSQRLQLILAKLNEPIKRIEESQSLSKQEQEFIEYAKAHPEEFREEEYIALEQANTEKEEPKPISTTQTVKNINSSVDQKFKVKSPSELKQDAIRRAELANAEGFKYINGQITKRSSR